MVDIQRQKGSEEDRVSFTLKRRFGLIGGEDGNEGSTRSIPLFRSNYPLTRERGRACRAERDEAVQKL